MRVKRVHRPKRQAVLILRIFLSEKFEIKERASKQGLSMSEYVRRRALEDRDPVAVDWERFDRELGARYRRMPLERALAETREAMGL